MQIGNVVVQVLRLRHGAEYSALHGVIGAVRRVLREECAGMKLEEGVRLQRHDAKEKREPDEKEGELREAPRHALHAVRCVAYVDRRDAVATAAAGSLSIVVEWTAPLRMSVERIDREVYRKLVDAAAPASIEAQIALDARLDALRRCTLAEAVRKVGGMESWVHDEVVWHRCVYMRDPCAFEHKTDVHFPLPLSSFIFPLQGRDTALRCLSRAEPRCKPAPHRGRLSARSARSGNARRPGAGAER